MQQCAHRLIAAFARPAKLLLYCAVLVVLGGCGAQGSGGGGTRGDLFVSVINVTPFEVSVVLSGVQDDAVDTVERTVEPSGTSEVTFVCVDELVVGDPLNVAAAGVTISADEQTEEVSPFVILAGESYACGDIVEVIVSGATPETFAVDVFAFPPP